jgi:hypothetical protein
VVTVAITYEERSVAVEAITCAIAGNSVRITPNRRRSPREIGAIVELVADELDANVAITARPDAVEVAPPLR